MHRLIEWMRGELDAGRIVESVESGVKVRAMSGEPWPMTSGRTEVSVVVRVKVDASKEEAPPAEQPTPGST